MDAPKQRKSLTKTQLTTAAGLELLNICQSITADGKIDDEEINSLNQWVKENKDSDIPAIKALDSVLSTVLADGILSEDERRSVAETIESILPLSERQLAKSTRRKVEIENKRITLEQSQLLKPKKIKPLASIDFMIAGTRHDDRQVFIDHELKELSPIFLKRDLKNRHSKYAIAVLTDRGNMVGFMPEDDARIISPLIDSGATYIAHIKKILEYRSGDIPVVIAQIFEAGTEPKPSSPPPPSSQPHCRWPLILGVIAILFVVYLSA